MAYDRSWSATQPGCLIILIDQSRSMSLPFGQNQMGAGRKKADAVATVVNNLLHEFVKSNTTGTEIRPRAEIAILGYGSKGDIVQNAFSQPLSSKPFVTLPDLMLNPLMIEQRSRKEIDEEGHVIEVPVDFPVWVKPRAGGRTPMCKALRRATALAGQWAREHSESYPPVIVNVTDGGASDGDPTVPVRKLRLVHTEDGHALLFNCHISEKPGETVQFPDNVNRLPKDDIVQLLFLLSSEIPESARKNILETTGQALEIGARGFIFNGDAASVRLMFNFATIAAQIADSR